MIEQRHGVVDDGRLAPGKAHENSGATIGRVPGQRLARLPRRPLQSRLQHQVLERIAGQKELCEHDQLGAGLA